MPDLNDINSAQSVKIIGADASGVETNPMDVDSSGNAKTVNNNAGGAAAVNIQDGGNSITVDAVALPLPTGAATATLQTTGNASLASIDAGIPAALGAATTAASMPVNIASDQTVPVSAVALPLPSGAATSANQTTGNASLASIDTKTPALVSGRQPVDGSGVTQPISAAALPLPAGASTSALQTTTNASLASIDAGIPAALGAATISASMPVNIASDQTVPISAASLPLPSGAATSANQTTEITSLQLIDDVPTAQNGAFVKGTPIMGQLDDTATTAATENNAAAVRITAQRALHTNLRDTSGTAVGTPANPLSVRPDSDKSVFGSLIVASRLQQIAVDFSQSIANNTLIQSVVGTGTNTLSNANAVISTGTGTTSSAQLQTTSTTQYNPGREIYAQFTAAFTTPTSAASTQYAGLYNGTDGLLIGFTGLNFGISSIAASVFTTVAVGSFNVDTLTGAAGSLFTRAGVPEAINYTFKNLYRIRAGWLGAAPIFFEVMAPDGNWVVFHIIRQPNSSISPAFLQPSLPLTMLVTKTASNATDLKITTTSWDAGIVNVAGGEDSSNAGTIAALSGSIIVNTLQRSTVGMDITGTWVGTLQIQADIGDGTWNAIYGINTNAVSAQNYTANTTIIIPCAGYSVVRIIATAWTSGTANINWVSTQGIQGVLAQAVGNIASGQPDVGNPVKIGGVYNSTLPTVATGSRVDLQLDASGRLLTSTTVTSQLPAASFTSNPTINAGVTTYTAFTAAIRLAIKQFFAGGTGIGKQELYSYLPSTTTFVNAGDFETPADINTTWVWTSGGTGSIASSTSPFFTGARSVALTFTNSSGANAQGVKQTFGTALDVSGWRYVTAEFYNTVSAGGAYTRTVSIILTDTGGNTKKFDLSGLSTASPFNATGWNKITGEIQNPTSTTGTGFDNTQVISLELRLNDSANKAGTVNWDTVKLEGQLTPIFPIYHQANSSFNISIDPVFVMQIGDQVIIAQTNNDSARKEYFAAANGVSI